MRRRWLALAAGLAAGGLLVQAWPRSGEPSAPGPTPRAGTARPGPAEPPDAASPALPAGGGSGAQRAPELPPTAGADRPPDTAAPAPRRGSRDVEALKQEIYARRIDSVDRLPLLDDLVQTDRDPRELWDAEWGGVDDWKRAANGFRLEKVDGDTHMFIPDPATMRTYTFFESIQPFRYDEKSGEFVNTVSYYGKPIYNVLRFLDEDVAVMMTISGAKVDLQIYEKGAPSGDDGASPPGRRPLVP